MTSRRDGGAYGAECIHRTLFSVSAPAIVNAVEPDQICEGTSQVDVIGENLLAQTQVLLGDVEATAVALTDVDRISASFDRLEPGVYDVRAENGDACGTTLQGAVEVVAKPILLCGPPSDLLGRRYGHHHFLAGVNGDDIQLKFPSQTRRPRQRHPTQC